jgi:excisionase family DNA binding protein
MEHDTWTVKELAGFLKVSQQMVYNLIKADELPAFKVGTSVRVLDVDLKDYIGRQKKSDSSKSPDGPLPRPGFVQVKDYSVRLGTFTLSGVNFEFPVGSSLGIIGSSGSGKSLFLHSLAGLIAEEGGFFLVNGEEQSGKSPLARKTGYVFQDYTLYPHIDSGGNIGFPQMIRGERKEVQDETVLNLAKRLGIAGEYLDRKAGILPEGIKQLVAIGRAENRDARVILMDEPLVHLDANVRHTMRAFLSELRREIGVTTIYAFNDLADAMTLSEYLVVFMNGAQVMFGKPMDVFNNPANREVMQLMSMHGLNEVRAEAINGRVFPGNIKTSLGDGPGTLCFRPEEVEIGRGPFTLEIAGKTVLDGNTVMARGKIADGQDVTIAVPAETETGAAFAPTHPQFFPAAT